MLEKSYYQKNEGWCGTLSFEKLAAGISHNQSAKGSAAFMIIIFRQSMVISMLMSPNVIHYDRFGFSGLLYENDIFYTAFN